jgi:hypothetical protein
MKPYNLILAAILASLPAIVGAQYYGGGTLKSHGHSTAADGGIITNLATTGKMRPAELIIASSVTAGRPIPPVIGEIFYNTDLGAPEYFNGTNWWTFFVQNSSFSATGGTETTDGVYRTHTLTNGQIFRVSGTSGNTADVLICAGGGGGGTNEGGGGGGGGCISWTAYSLTPGTYTAIVGAGGGSNANGSNTTFFSTVAVGGGKGGTYPGTNPGNGGSGGGDYASHFVPGSGIAGQGYAGGSNYGGGGGAGGAGGSNSGAGGPGIQWPAASGVYYGSGGGGNGGTSPACSMACGGPFNGSGSVGTVKIRYPISAGIQPTPVYVASASYANVSGAAAFAVNAATATYSLFAASAAYAPGASLAYPFATTPSSVSFGAELVNGVPAYFFRSPSGKMLLGCNASNGECGSQNVYSEGLGIMSASAGSDTYARIKSDRFGLTHALDTGQYYFRADRTGAYIANQENTTANKIFEVVRASSLTVVRGSLQYIDGNQSAGRVLISDALGVATWQAAAGGGEPGFIAAQSTIAATNIPNTFSSSVTINTAGGLSILTGENDISMGYLPAFNVSAIMLAGSSNSLVGYFDAIKGNASIMGMNGAALSINTSTAAYFSLLDMGSPQIMFEADGNSYFYGDLFDRRVAIGTYPATARLDLDKGISPYGFRYRDGSEGAGKVLVSDANGYATWTADINISTVAATVFDLGVVFVSSSTGASPTDLTLSAVCPAGKYVIAGGCQGQSAGFWMQNAPSANNTYLCTFSQAADIYAWANCGKIQ